MSYSPDAVPVPRHRFHSFVIAAHFFLIPALLLSLTTTPVRSEMATAEEMEQVCRNWLTTMVTVKGQWAGSADPRIIEAREIIEKDTLLARYYAIEPAGYVIVPALKEMPPIKAYSEESSLTIDDAGGLAAMIREVLLTQASIFAQAYGSMEATQKGSPTVFPAANRDLWNRLAVPSDRFTADPAGERKSSFREVGPLLTTAWRQGAPYKDSCPPGYGGEPCVVGCVATAAAQIIRYHQWPPRGRGFRAYYWLGDFTCDNEGTPPRMLMADFSDPYSYDDSPEAVAELSHDVGIAFHMFYGRCGSSADVHNGTYVFSDYFRYAPGAMMKDRIDFTAEEWFDIIQDELDHGRPMLYRIFMHAIVCDGWRQVSGFNQYHCNYGWADGATTWYTVDELYCPWAGCTPMQEYMVIGIAPPKEIPWLAGTSLSDQALGDGDGIPEAGETVDLTVTLANYADQGLTDVSAELLIDDAAVTILDGEASYAYIGAKDSADNAADPFRLSIPFGYTSRIDSFFLVLTSGGGAVVDTLAFEIPLGKSHILLVDDDNGKPYEIFYRENLDRLRAPYDVWNSPFFEPPDSAFLAGYDAVIWFTGDFGPYPLSAMDMVRIRQYLDGGGGLALSGQGIGMQLNSAAPALLHDYLKAEYRSSSSAVVFDAAPGCQAFLPGDSIYAEGEGGASNILGPGQMGGPDHVVPINGGAAELAYRAESDFAAVSYAGTFRTILFGFGLEAVINGDPRWTSRDTAMARILTFLECPRPGGYPQVQDLGPVAVSPLHIVDHTPTIRWTYYDPQGLTQDQYQVQVGVDADWSTAETWDAGPVSGADTAIVYGGAALADGASYYVRARVYNGRLWSNWSQITCRMNSAPSLPSGLSPAGMAGVVSMIPELTTPNADNADGDSLTYGFEVYADTQMTMLIASADDVPEGSDVTRWQVATALSEDQRYFWRVRADDGFESGAWSPSAAFWINAVNQTPSGFILISPANGSRLENRQPTFVWNASHDGDAYDKITYTLAYAKDSFFTQPELIPDVHDTTLTLAQPIATGGKYYWRVKAADDFDGAVFSSAVYSFIMALDGDANGDGKITVGDAVYIVGYIFRGGPAPEPLAAGDINGDCRITVGDAVYVISYIFRAGPAPKVGCAK